MVCDDVRAAVSAALDGAGEFDEAHLAACEECRRFERGVRRLRSAVRFEVIDAPPDLAGRVLAAIDGPTPTAPRHRPQPRRLVPAVAAFVAGAVAGAVFVWPADPGDGVAAATLAGRIVAAQDDVASLTAEVTVIEHHPDRVRTGVLRYRAPDHLELRLGPTVLEAGDGAWRLANADGSVLAKAGLEPFSSDGPVPLDLVLPASGFVGADPPAVLGTRAFGSRTAVGVQVPAAQVNALLAGLRPGGDGREVHPTDVVDLWLDERHLVPLGVVVRAADGPDRARWAARRGYEEDAGAVIVEARFDDVRLNDARTVDDLAPPDTAGAPDGGFRPGRADVPEPGWLPPGMADHASGTVGDVAVRTWTDGRAWVKVRATDAWTGSRLFGGIGDVVRAVPLGRGIGYVAEDGTTVAVHGDAVDLVVSGSLAPEDLRRVGASLGVVGRPVPSTWAEHSTADLADLARVAPGHLLVPADAWPGPPAVRLDGRTAVLVYAGPGDRAVVLASREDASLSPPFDPDATGVVVRDRVGRWSPSRGELEWVEDGRLWTLRSTTVGLPELVALAGRMERHR